jgi:hypothetical protein
MVLGIHWNIELSADPPIELSSTAFGKKERSSYSLQFVSSVPNRRYVGTPSKVMETFVG